MKQIDRMLEVTPVNFAERDVAGMEISPSSWASDTTETDNDPEEGTGEPPSPTRNGARQDGPAGMEAHKPHAVVRLRTRPVRSLPADVPEVFCANLRDLALTSHRIVSATRAGGARPARCEIDDLLRRLIALQHQIDRLRLYHGLQTAQLERWAENLLREVLATCGFGADASQ